MYEGGGGAIGIRQDTLLLTEKSGFTSRLRSVVSSLSERPTLIGNYSLKRHFYSTKMGLYISESHQNRKFFG